MVSINRIAVAGIENWRFILRSLTRPRGDRRNLNCGTIETCLLLNDNIGNVVSSSRYTALHISCPKDPHFSRGLAAI
jgi:hypothetical protein